jgi:hypothetical protein
MMDAAEKTAPSQNVRDQPQGCSYGIQSASQEELITNFRRAHKAIPERNWFQLVVHEEVLVVRVHKSCLKRSACQKN